MAKKIYVIIVGILALLNTNSIGASTGQAANERISNDARLAARMAEIPPEEVRILRDTVGEQEGEAGKTKRRVCIDSGRTWVTNSHGSFCIPRGGAAITNSARSAAHESAMQSELPVAMQIAREGAIKPPLRFRGTAESGNGPQGWVWLERRRCVRSGGVFHEKSSGTFCWKLLDPA